MFNYKMFCKKVKSLREARGYNKYQMSIQANIHYEYYCDMENGKAIPNFKAVIYIANALHVNLAELLSDTEDNEEDIKILNITSNVKKIDNLYLANKCYEILLLIKNQDV